VAKQPSRDNANAETERGTTLGAATSRAAAVESGGSLLGMVGNIFLLAVAGIAVLVGKLWHNITADKHLAAFGRQGIDELGVALKAFPDAIQVQEPGTVWNPTQGEIAADRKPGFQSSYYTSFSSSPPHPWPSEVNRDRADGSDRREGRDQGNDYDAGASM
jgi:hypothetical protein